MIMELKVKGRTILTTMQENKFFGLVLINVGLSTAPLLAKGYVFSDHPGALEVAAALAKPVAAWWAWGMILSVGVMLAGGRSTFREIFVIAVKAWTPFALRGLLQTLFLLVTESPVGNPGLAGFAPVPDLGDLRAGLLRNALATVDIYLLVHLGLLGAWVGQASSLSRRKVIVLVAGGAALMMGLSFIPTLVSNLAAGWINNAAF
jgi:hypothetical protein